MSSPNFSQSGYATVSVMVVMFAISSLIAAGFGYVTAERLKNERYFANIRAHWAMMGTVSAFRSMAQQKWSASGLGICGGSVSVGKPQSCETAGKSVSDFLSSINGLFSGSESSNPLLARWIYPIQPVTTDYPEELSFYVSSIGTDYFSSMNQSTSETPNGLVQLGLKVKKYGDTWPSIFDHLLGTNIDTDHTNLAIGLCVRDQSYSTTTSQYNTPSGITNCSLSGATTTSVGQSRIEYVRRTKTE